MRRKPKPLADRFWPKVNKDAPNGCWEWTRSLDGRGYGQIWYNARPWKAYRVALLLSGVEPPKRKDGMCVDHICRNPLCVNPAHLRVVSDKVNATENNDNPFVRNHHKKECVHHHPFADENIALIRCTGPKGTPMLTRICLTCYPQYWHKAVIERARPPRARLTWRGPDKLEP